MKEMMPSRKLTALGNRGKKASVDRRQEGGERKLRQRWENIKDSLLSQEQWAGQEEFTSRTDIIVTLTTEEGSFTE